MKILRGKSVCGEIGIGKIFIYKRRNAEEKKIGHVEEELAAYEKALSDTEVQLGGLYEQCVQTIGEKEAFLFEAQRLLVRDEAFTGRVRAAISNCGTGAYTAVAEAGEAMAREMETIPDDYISQRAKDVRDVTRMLLENLAGGAKTASDGVDAVIIPQEPFLLVAKELTPAELVGFAGNMLKGMWITEGTLQSHVAILAKGMGVATVFGAEEFVNGVFGESVGNFDRQREGKKGTVDGQREANLEKIDSQWEGKIAALDGEKGILYLEPDEETMLALERRKEEKSREREQLAALKGMESITSDGRCVKVYANVGTLSEAEHALNQDAGGIGLLRSELLYLGRESAPDEETQYDFYKKILECMGEREVGIRTFDIGADKQVPYLQQEPEENPALGVRGIRLGLLNQELLLTQLRALYRAGMHGNLHIMYPMITSVAELDRLKELEETAKRQLREAGIQFVQKVPTGIMIETPAAALLSEKLAKKVDFFSVGTNDLTQYTLAMERGNEKLGNFADAEHEAVLRLIEMAAKSAHAAGIWIGICGELAADTGLTEKFVELGIDELSVAPSEILKVRKKIREL